MDDRLGITITHPSFGTRRWGPDDLAAGNVPVGLTFSTSVPGGHKDCSHTLLRNPLNGPEDLRLAADVRVWGAGNETVWEGRHVQFPRGERETSPGAVGHAAELRDDNSFQMVYADRDHSRWGSAGRARRMALINAGSKNFDPRHGGDPTSGDPRISTPVTDTWGVGGVRGEAWYDVGAGLTWASIGHKWAKGGSDFGALPGAWDWRLYACQDDATTNESTANLVSAGPGSGTFTPATARRFALLILAHTAAGGTAGSTWQIDWDPTVYGSHSLTKRGTAPEGFYASDIIADIVSRTAPRLRFTRGAGGSIQDDTSFIVPHSVYRGGTTGEAAIFDMMKYLIGWEWGVFGREFFLRQADADRLTWDVRLSEGARLRPEGEQLEDLYNGVVVIWRDPAGVEHMTGPPGSATSAQSAKLEDKSTSNPVNAAGIQRRWAQLQIGDVTTAAGALRIGELWLAERARTQYRGEVEFVGHAHHPTRGRRPAWAVRAGDYVRIAERPNDPPRRIIETRYTHDTRTCAATTDNALFSTEALLERMGLALVGVI